MEFIVGWSLIQPILSVKLDYGSNSRIRNIHLTDLKFRTTLVCDRYIRNYNKLKKFRVNGLDILYLSQIVSVSILVTQIYEPN